MSLVTYSLAFGNERRIKMSITPNNLADFTPKNGDYKTLQPFRYWCQKVLPLVYDDSLSYYELLCKVVDYLNKTMEDVETLHGDVTNLHNAYKKLQNYVNMYFGSLDVQQEINNKLDEMASSGELELLIQNHFAHDLLFSTHIGETVNEKYLQGGCYVSGTTIAICEIDEPLTTTTLSKMNYITGEIILSKTMSVAKHYNSICYDGKKFYACFNNNIIDVLDSNFNIIDAITCSVNVNVLGYDNGLLYIGSGNLKNGVTVLTYDLLNKAFDNKGVVYANGNISGLQQVFIWNGMLCFLSYGESNICMCSIDTLNVIKNCTIHNINSIYQYLSETEFVCIVDDNTWVIGSNTNVGEVVKSFDLIRPLTNNRKAFNTVYSPNTSHTIYLGNTVNYSCDGSDISPFTSFAQCLALSFDNIIINCENALPQNNIRICRKNITLTHNLSCNSISLYSSILTARNLILSSNCVFENSYLMLNSLITDVQIIATKTTICCVTLNATITASLCCFMCNYLNANKITNEGKDCVVSYDKLIGSDLSNYNLLDNHKVLVNLDITVNESTYHTTALLTLNSNTYNTYSTSIPVGSSWVMLYLRYTWSSTGLNITVKHIQKPDGTVNNASVTYSIIG